MQAKIFCFLIVLFSAFTVKAQKKISTDSSRVLKTVTVKAYEQNRQLKEVSAAVNVIDKAQIEQYGNVSLVPSVNSTPGVRMEERSPGSYRLNIRGSTLRSPFGVRNVKIYWNDIPFTDPGGNTYLNQLSLSNIESLEIIKGPAGSLYGAGTGGAVLIQIQPAHFVPGINAGYTGGSYNTNALNVQFNAGTDARRNSFTYSHQTSDGYRYHTNMRRDVGTWETALKVSDKQQLSASFLYGDLYYQTPGALTLKEYTANPRAYRPPAGGLPDAETTQAAIYQKMMLAGITNRYRFNKNIENTTTAYGTFVQFANPTFRTYEKRSEPSLGGRTVFTFNQRAGKTNIHWVAGAEAQRGFFNTKDFKNNKGNPDSLQTDDDINSWDYSVFVQGDVKLPGNWIITAGASFNKFHVSDQRLSTPGLAMQERTYSNELAPRLAISKKIIADMWAYGSIAKGFSPPAIAEVLPPSRTISTTLNAEKGINYELGIKSNWLNNRLYVEVNAFYFRLKDAIVQRTQANSANYYVNAGDTKQKGLESQASYQLLNGSSHVLQQAKIRISHTLNNFVYDNFIQGAVDYSGKKMPSVAKNTVAAGLDIAFKAGFYANVTYYYSDPIPMNDANTEFAASYNLLGARIGYEKRFSAVTMNLFAGADNLFNVTYSLGNDINAAAGRYYNAAAGKNYFAGVSFQWNKKGR